MRVLRALLFTCVAMGAFADPSSAAVTERIAFASDRDGDYDIYAMNPDGSNVVQLTQGPGENMGGSWSPDGSKIAFLSTRDGGAAEIYVMQANGGNPVRLTTNRLAEGGRIAWSPDGSKIAFYASSNADLDIYVMDADGGNVTRLTEGPSHDRSPTWSPDGRRIAFTSDRDGDDEVYIMNADGTGPVRLTTSAAPDVLDAWQR